MNIVKDKASRLIIANQGQTVKTVIIFLKRKDHFQINLIMQIKINIMRSKDLIPKSQDLQVNL